jgi:hypothetical protein
LLSEQKLNYVNVGYVMDVIGHVIKDLLNYWHTTQLHHPGIQSQMSIWATMTLWLSILEQSWIDATCFVCPCFYLELTHFAITRMRIKKNFHEHLFREHFLLHCTTRELINSSLNLKKKYIFNNTIITRFRLNVLLRPM